MKVCTIGLDLPEGKVKYHDDKFVELVKKCDPLKVTPFYVEFIRDDFVHADAFVVAADRVLDLLILDMEKLEGRLDHTEDTWRRPCWLNAWRDWSKRSPCVTSNFPRRNCLS